MEIVKALRPLYAICVMGIRLPILGNAGTTRAFFVERAYMGVRKSE